MQIQSDLQKDLQCKPGFIKTEKKMAEKKQFDEYQKAAINARKNSVVSAGAGSGKTTVLATRFLSLIKDSETSGKGRINADEILTLTFTKKATVEMASRIYSVLKKEAPEQAEIFYKANIKTLDSYCTSVARLGAHYFGMTPDFTQNSEEIERFMKSKALPFILKNRDNEAIKALVSTRNYADIAEELFVQPLLKNSKISEPLDFDLMLEKQIEEIHKKIKLELKETNKLISLLYNANLEYDGKITSTITEFRKNLQTEIPSVSEIPMEDILSGRYDKLKSYILAVSNLTKKLPAGKSEKIEEIKEICQALREHVPANFEKNKCLLASFANFIAGIHDTRLLISLLNEFQEILNDFKRTSGFLTFADISDLALKTLIHYPELRQIEKEKYKAIMIDEFQDNNSMQRDLLFLLAEKLDRKEKSVPDVSELCPDKLFFVGDEKQSIYIFRGADVSVFRALSKDFTEGNLSMNTNYRSDSALIASFNTIFGGFPYPPERFLSAEAAKQNPPSAFYSENKMDSKSIVPDYEAIYHEVSLPQAKIEEAEQAQAKGEIHKIFSPHVHFAFYEKEQEENSDRNTAFLTGKECEAEWIAEKIQELTTKGINGKTYSYSDIAILFKTYSPQTLFEKVFLSHGIPYNSEIVKGFFADGPINDIFALLKICLYPNDTVSYAQVLKSPFVNLSFDEMNAVIIQNKESPEFFTLKDENLLCDESLERFKNAKDFYETIKKESKISPLTKLISKIWYETGYRYETIWNSKVQMYDKLYDLLFELARQADQKSQSLAEFIDDMFLYKQESEKLQVEIPLDQTSGVHILSIHKSKGLEYPVVFVVNTNAPPRNDSNTAPVFVDKEFGFSMNTPPIKEFGTTSGNYFYLKSKESEEAKNSAELRRVAYVALTRAKNELFITCNSYKMDCEAAEKFVPGGTNNVKTLFQILEPSVNFYRNQENLEFCPYDFETISPIERNSQAAQDSRANTNENKAKVIAEIQAEKLYEKASVLEKEKLEPRYVLPSQLHDQDEESGKNIFAELPENALFREINGIVLKTIPEEEKQSENPEPKFSFADFGTMAHAYMESAITKLPPKIPNSLISALESAQDLEKLKEICLTMQKSFLDSEIGKRALSSIWHEAEYAFKSLLTDETTGKEKIIKGTMDLVFKEEDGTYTIVDYKTNSTIQPELYYRQLGCYRQAIAQMLGIDSPEKIRCVLYYLRFAKEIDVSAEAKA